MRWFWELAEALDNLQFKVMDKLDEQRKLGPLLERTELATREVRAPQRVLTFDDQN